MTSPTNFLRQVRQETNKVSWPSRKETMVTTAMVFVMVVVASIFLFLTDQVIATVLRMILGIGA